MEKKIKKLKSHFPTLFLAKTPIGRKREQKYLYRILSVLGLGKKIPKKIAKKFDKLKNLIPALFLPKTGWDRLRKWEKKFRLKLRSYLT